MCCRECVGVWFPMGNCIAMSVSGEQGAEGMLEEFDWCLNYIRIYYEGAHVKNQNISMILFLDMFDL